MFVNQFMTCQVFTISSKESIFNAMNILKGKRINRLPVVDNGRLVGIVTDGDLRAASPSPVTSLSKFEMTELLSKVTVRDVAVKKVITCTPDTLIEDAALLMREHKIGALPVLEGDKIVGIISSNDLLDAFIDIMGSRSPGKRIVIEMKDEVGVFYEVTAITKKHGVDITSLAVFHLPNHIVQILTHLNGEFADEAIKEIKEKGFKITE